MYTNNERFNYYANDNFTQLEQMYHHLTDGYINMQKRLDKTLKENVKLKSFLDKNIHPFID